MPLPRALGLVLLVPLAATVATAQVGGVGGAGAAASIPATRGTSLTQVPWVSAQGGFGPVEVDTSVGGPGAGDGNPITIGGRTFASGLGTAATSLVTYDLRGGARVFTSWVGVDDEVGAAGSVVFRVVADGELLFDSGLLTGADGAVYTGALDVQGVSELQLLVLDGGDGAALDHADWADPYLLVPGGAVVGGTGAASRGLRGKWEPAMDWPVQAIHASLLPSGHVLSHASVLADAAGTDDPNDPHDSTRADLADVATWSHQPVDHPTEELYGAGHARGHDGCVLALGGHAGRDGTLLPFGRAQASRFDAATASWIPVADLVQPRWGAAALTLGNGDVLALGGAHAGGNVFRPEVFDGCAWRLLDEVDTTAWWNNGDPAFDDTWPFAHLASDGRVFISGWDEDMGFFDVRGRGESFGPVPREAVQRLWGSAAVHGPDRVLITGGVDHPGGGGDALRSSVTVDFSGAVPVASPSGDLFFPRADASAVVLADGSVLLHGGGATHSDGANPSHVRVPEIWDPATGTWTVAAASAHPRGYRSTALLLPDARVWAAGGECGPGCGSGETAEVFRPPYLYTATGALAPRPKIVAAPPTIDYGDSFAVTMSNGAAVSRVTLVRYGSTTHGVDFDQRFLELSFTKGGATLTVDAPANGYAAPPGPYLLFAFDAAGVPSVAATVALQPEAPAAWKNLTTTDGSACVARHETAMVELGGRFYLIGGRGSKPVQEYDPVERVWRTRGFPPQQIHHFQPVVLDGLVWVVGAFVGGYPNETPIPNILLYDPVDDSWSTGPPMPAGRNRGSAAAVVFDDRIWFVGGNTMGHNGGAVPWFDVFDPATGNWTALPDAPHARDHFLVAVVGNKLVAAGGRTTDQPNPFDDTVPEVDVYDFSTGVWGVNPNDIPTERAGTMTVAVGQHVVVAGGESDPQTDAHDEVEALDVLTGEWLALPPLFGERHSGGIVEHDGRIWVASGAGNRGGGPELTTFEVLGAADLLAGTSTNPVVNASFDAGLVGWTVVGDVALSSLGGVKPPALRVRAGEATQELAASPGSVTLTTLFQASGGAGTAALVLVFLDGGGVELGSKTRNLPAVSRFTTVEVVGNAPAGTTAVRLRVVADGEREVLVDDLAVDGL